MVASADRNARLLDLNGNVLHIFKHQGAVNCVAFSTKQVLTTSADGSARLWTLKGDSLLRFDHVREVTNTMFSPSGDLILRILKDG
ncbi:WD40 repeat domain-containing protein [Xanthocytophaga agilis]|uniref:WD40 repeat domain-containing protein n=1 Tax=Xanthocytophaga agilis TaxID=3048010 RepID=UPI003B0028E1